MENIKLKCEKCGTEYEIHPASFRRRKRLGRGNLCKICVKEFIKNNTQSRWDKLTEEDKKKQGELLNKGRIEWENKLTEEDRKELSKSLSERNKKYWESLTEEERIEKGKENYKSLINWRKNLSKEEKERLSNNRKEAWNNLTEEEKNKKINELSRGNKEWWDNLSEEDKLIHINRLNDAFGEWKNNLSKEEFSNICYNNAVKNNMSERKYSPSSNESEFTNILNSNFLQYETSYYNTSKHEKFDELFPINPITNSKFINPYHKWDFLIKTKKKNILVDIDGGIHDPTKMNFPIPRKNYTMRELIAFNDSQRPYQTDGLESYIIKCYDDNLTDECVVESITDSNMKLTFKQFISYLILMNV